MQTLMKLVTLGKKKETELINKMHELFRSCFGDFKSVKQPLMIAMDPDKQCLLNDKFVELEREMCKKELVFNIGYSYEWNMDPDDEVWVEDEQYGDLIDFDNTLVYATNFKLNMISIYDRGLSACIYKWESPVV